MAARRIFRGLTDEDFLGACFFVVRMGNDEVLYLFMRTEFVYRMGQDTP
ncbi:hypothetical protein [Corallococcus terminator]|nr:hypothetical protein [Corallococcus terminator]